MTDNLKHAGIFAFFPPGSRLSAERGPGASGRSPRERGTSEESGERLTHYYNWHGQVTFAAGRPGSTRNKKANWSACYAG